MQYRLKTHSRQRTGSFERIKRQSSRGRCAARGHPEVVPGRLVMHSQ